VSISGSPFIRAVSKATLHFRETRIAVLARGWVLPDDLRLFP